MPAAPFDVLLVADNSTLEVADTVAALEAFGRPTRRATGFVDALRAVRETAPDVVIVLQTWPDEFGRERADELIAAAPLARWIVGVGAWCESVGRNRDAWPVAVRVPLALVPSRIERELTVLNRERGPLPLTASRDETFGDAVTIPAADVHDVTVTVRTPDRHLRESWRDLLTATGFEVVERNASCLVADVDPWPTRVETPGTLENSNVRIAVTDQVTPSRTRALDEAGFTRVIPKLAPATILVAAVTRPRRQPTSDD